MKNFWNIKALGLLILSSTCALFGTSANAGAEWQRGFLIDMSAIRTGLLIRLDTGVPTNCAGVAAYGWMLIPEANKTMIAFAMGKWLSNQRGVDIYVSYEGGTCVVTQVDSN